jgi:hypothetical protein
MRLVDKVKALLHRKPKATQTLSAKIIRKDGTEEDLGVISETRSPGWSVKADG